MLNKDIKIAIIGAGISGLATAVRLKTYGFQVDVFEKSYSAGGKINEIYSSGFRFDSGPSLFTLPHEFLKLFDISGFDFRDYFKYTPLKIICKYFYDDGLIINAYNNVQHLAEEFKSKTGEDKKRVLKYLNCAKELYDLSADIFIFNSIHDFTTFKKAGIKGFKTLFKLDALRSYHQLNQSFFKSQHVVQLFDRYATYNGSNPYKAPATLKVIGHLEHNMGAYFPVNGMYTIISSLVKLGQEKGVNFYFGNKVEKIRKNANESIELDSETDRYNYHAIVNSTDVRYFYDNILKGYKLPKRLKRTEPSSSAIIFYWGITKEFPELELHNILFSSNYREEFEYIFSKKDIFNDPTIYIFISSKVTKNDAPEGCENWFVMINTPADFGQNWNDLIIKAKKCIIEKVNRILKTSLESYIITENINSPVTLSKSTSSFRGSIYGISSNSIWSAFNRHPNYSSRYKNIYYTGGSVHPGGGIPLCLASAEIVCNRIIKDFSKNN